MKLLYNALIRSILDYGTFLLHPGNTGAIKKLDFVQSKALRLVTGAMKSTPINCLQVECCDPPLYLRRQLLCDKFFFRTLQLISHPLFPKVKQLADQIDTCNYWTHKDSPCLVKSYKKYESLGAPTHRSVTLPLYQYNYKNLIAVPKIKLDIGLLKNSPNIKQDFINIVNNEWSDWHCLYTDASKHGSKSCVGVGVYHSQYQVIQQIKFPPETSVYTGECYGLLKAIEYILILKIPKTIVFTDSRSALEAIMGFPFKSHKQSPNVFRIRDLLYTSSQKNCNIVLAWVPSHVGIPGNERADQLANEAIRIGDIVPYTNHCSDLANQAKVYLYEEWDRVWNNDSSVGKHYKKIQ
ncbi:jg20563, partial [Pararge aegeria aegeria]